MRLLETRFRKSPWSSHSSSRTRHSFGFWNIIMCWFIMQSFFWKNNFQTLSRVLDVRVCVCVLCVDCKQRVLKTNKMILFFIFSKYVLIIHLTTLLSFFFLLLDSVIFMYNRKIFFYFMFLKLLTYAKTKN